MIRFLFISFSLIFIGCASESDSKKISFSDLNEDVVVLVSSQKVPFSKGTNDEDSKNDFINDISDSVDLEMIDLLKNVLP